MKNHSTINNGFLDLLCSNLLKNTFNVYFEDNGFDYPQCLSLVQQSQVLLQPSNNITHNCTSTYKHKTGIKLNEGDNFHVEAELKGLHSECPSQTSSLGKDIHNQNQQSKSSLSNETARLYLLSKVLFPEVPGGWIA